MSTENTLVEKIRPLKSLKEYFGQLYLIFCAVSMTWVLANDDHNLIKYWYTFVIASLMAFRIVSFFRKGWQCFLIEMCYVMTMLSLFIIWFDYDIKIIYPFIHGPLAFYTLGFGDAAIFNNLAKSTTFALHSGGGIVTRRLYWNGDPNLIVGFADLTLNSFKTRLIDCIKLYFLWAFPYYIWLFSTNWKLTNMAKDIFGVKPEDDLDFLKKILCYSFCMYCSDSFNWNIIYAY